MLESLRKNQKWIIWFIAVVFILGMAVMGVSEVFYPKPYVGKIYGKKVLFQDYDKMLRQFISQQMQQNPDMEMDDQTYQRMSDQYWERFVNQKIMEKQIKRYHIKVTDNDVLDKLKNDPPAELQYNPQFQTNGVFDKQKYMSLLTTNEEFASMLESYIRESLPYEKLEDKIKSLAKVVDDSARIEYIAKNEKVTGKLIYFDYNNIPAETVSEKEIKDYYEANKEKDYKKEASAKYKYVKFALVPSKDDAAQAKVEIDNIYNDLLSGQDFAELAKSYSQDPGSASRGGDLGFFAKGSMVTEFSDVAFSLPVGQVSQPFKTSFGWHILKVTGKKTNEKGEPEVQASHILISLKASEKTKMEVRDKAEEFYELANKEGIEKAAKTMNIKVEETMDFDEKAQAIPMLGRYPHLVKVAFKKGVGHLEKPVKIYDGSYMVAEVSSKQGKHFEDFNNVKDPIKFKLDRQKRIAKAAQMAEDFAKKATPDKYFEMAAAEGWKVIDFTDVNEEASIPEIGLNKDLNKALLALNTNQTSQVIKTENGAFIGFASIRTKADMNVWNTDKAKLTEEYRTRKQNQFYSEWYRKVREEAKVEDLRYLYY
ncbi:MAG TPA: peptidylprolyl isomerase [Candidatus Cloacimonadota bacterium]|nr:peptidylprolyl isomerase [Candidatus Cloacimonadota bacterium]